MRVREACGFVLCRVCVVALFLQASRAGEVDSSRGISRSSSSSFLLLDTACEAKVSSIFPSAARPFFPGAGGSARTELRRETNSPGGISRYLSSPSLPFFSPSSSSCSPLPFLPRIVSSCTVATMTRYERLQEEKALLATSSSVSSSSSSSSEVRHSRPPAADVSSSSPRPQLLDFDARRRRETTSSSLHSLEEEVGEGLANSGEGGGPDTEGIHNEAKNQEGGASKREVEPEEKQNDRLHSFNQTADCVEGDHWAAVEFRPSADRFQRDRQGGKEQNKEDHPIRDFSS